MVRHKKTKKWFSRGSLLITCACALGLLLSANFRYLWNAHTHIDDTTSTQIVFMKTTEPIRLRQKSETSSSTTAATLTRSQKEGCLLDWIQDGSGCYFQRSSQARLCVFHDYSMAIDSSRIIVSRGGEPAWDVHGRSEQDELFQAKPNAVYLKETKPNFHTKHYQQKLLDAATNVRPDACDTSFSGLTLILERIEYANLWHTMNDWFNVHWTLETLAIKSNLTISSFGGEQLRIIFLDGHAAGHLEEPWSVAFNASVHYISEFKPQTICFEHVAWVPKASPLWPPHKPCSDMMDRFVDRFLHSYGVARPSSSSGSNSTSMDDNIVIDRKPYVAHPRSMPTDVQYKDGRYIPNISAMFPSSRVVQLDTLSFREQLNLTVHAKTLKGVHGAGLTHLIWLGDGSTVVEWVPPSHSFGLFRNIAKWRPKITYRGEHMPNRRQPITQRSTSEKKK